VKKKKALLLIYCIALAPAALAHDIVTSRYTYREHVLPILNAHCVRCHSPDGPAPFRLTSYLDARPRAEAIKEEVLLRNMPPWFAEEGEHQLIGEDRLSASELDILVEWTSGGAPEGEGQVYTGAPRKKRAPEVADLELEIPELVLAPGRKQKTVQVRLATGLKQPAWITAWELSTAKVDLLRLATLHRDEPAAENYLGTRMSVDGKLSWNGAGASISPGQELVLTILYSRPWRLGNRKEGARGKLRLWMAEARPARLLQARQLADSGKLPPEALLLGVYPTAPLRLATAGRSDSLIEVFAAPEDWPVFYRLSKPLKYPAGLQAGPGAEGSILFSIP
jgi:mono/diheme cytochrome c family protein